MAKYRFEQIAINSTEKKKPVEEDRFTYLGLEHLDSGSLKVTRFGSEVAPIGEKLVMHKGDSSENVEPTRRKLPSHHLMVFSLHMEWFCDLEKT